MKTDTIHDWTYNLGLGQYRRIPTQEVCVGDCVIGGDHPIRIQSMTTTDTMDTDATVAQTLRMVEMGCELVRITAPSILHAENLQNIREVLHTQGCYVPLIADIHFTPNAAEIAARLVEKVRVNPGNYVDKKKFQLTEYSDQDYQEELERINERFFPLVKICKEYGTAMRIGTNHGSLSDRIMSRYGDTPRGMVESALEFVRICEEHDYDQIILSMKASNTQVMVQAYRLLMHEMLKRGRVYPLHLGVTEAGEGVDGRLKSAVGIGALLADGLGDTVRVSLTEDPEFEPPVAKYIVDCLTFEPSSCGSQASGVIGSQNPYRFERRQAQSVLGFGNATIPVIVSKYPSADVHEKDFDGRDDVAVLAIRNRQNIFTIRSEIFKMMQDGDKRPIVLDVRGLQVKLGENITGEASWQLSLASLLGPFLIEGFVDGVWVSDNESHITDTLALLQAARLRTVKTEYISCPSCGRTLFDLQETTASVRDKTSHLKGLKIAVMGCIVNGPGEMADADYGYVGSGPGKISLYRGNRVVKKNISSEDAVEQLVELIKNDGAWRDPKQQ